MNVVVAAGSKLYSLTRGGVDETVEELYFRTTAEALLSMFHPHHHHWVHDLQGRKEPLKIRVLYVLDNINVIDNVSRPEIERIVRVGDADEKRFGQSLKQLCPADNWTHGYTVPYPLASDLTGVADQNTRSTFSLKALMICKPRSLILTREATINTDQLYGDLVTMPRTGADIMEDALNRIMAGTRENQMRYLTLDAVTQDEPTPDAVIGPETIQRQPDLFNGISRNILVHMALGYDISAVAGFCMKSRAFNAAVCENEDFWLQKMEMDFPGVLAQKPRGESAKDFYAQTQSNDLNRYLGRVRPDGYNRNLFKVFESLKTTTSGIRFDSEGASRDGQLQYYYDENSVKNQLKSLGLREADSRRVIPMDRILEERGLKPMFYNAILRIVQGRGIDQENAFNGMRGYVLDGDKRYPLSVGHLRRLARLAGVAVSKDLPPTRNNLEAMRRAVMLAVERGRPQ